jgi:16S rRNA (adenine(1408)-N(1))-methyltransferase
VGTGDGAWALRCARADPSRFVIGIDTNAENLAEASRRASLKPQRGGTANVLYVQAAAEAPPPELEGIADSLVVLLPWGSLLQAVAAPEVAVLAGLARLCKPRAELRVVFGYDPSIEGAVAAALPPLTVEHMRALPARYAEAGFSVEARTLENREVANLRTTWAGRLAHGRARRFCELRGKQRPLKPARSS